MAELIFFNFQIMSVDDWCFRSYDVVVVADYFGRLLEVEEHLSLIAALTYFPFQVAKELFLGPFLLNASFGCYAYYY